MKADYSTWIITGKMQNMSEPEGPKNGIWGFPGFPKIGVPLVIIHFNGFVPYKASIWGYPNLWKPPYGLL